MIEIDEIHMTN